MWNPTPLLFLFLLLALSVFSVINGAVPNFYDRRDLQSDNTEIIQVADVNGDGIPDIIGGNGTNRIQVFFGRGDGTFSEGPVNTFAVAGIRASSPAVSMAMVLSTWPLLESSTRYRSEYAKTACRHERMLRSESRTADQRPY
jgi:hypothetical protein